MVCIYCGKATGVTNSRLQRRSNTVWRRRRCEACQAVFTSIERVDEQKAVVVAPEGAAALIPLSRDELFVSIYDSCRHRHKAIQDASALTDTILGKLLAQYPGVIPKVKLKQLAWQTLKRFDPVAAVHYKAYYLA
jgi:transcriptional regulator NrdR family protein